MRAFRKLLVFFLASALLAYGQGNTFTKVRYNGGSVASHVDPKDWDNKLVVSPDAITLDTTMLTFARQVATIVELATERGLLLPGRADTL